MSNTDAAHEITIAILAAGSSSRMRGGDKTLEPVEGEPLLRVLARRALTLDRPVCVTVPPDHPARRAALDGLPVRITEIPEASRGMAASFHALAATGTAILVCLADMPGIETKHLAALIAAYDGRYPVRATGIDGTPGQPVLFPPDLVARFSTLDGDEGARRLLRDRRVCHVALPGRVALTDLDTPEDWAAWRRDTTHR